MPSRRSLLATLSVAGLAGCGRRIRNNPVPGGLELRNRGEQPRTVGVAATAIPEPETTPERGETPTPEPAPVASAEYDVAAGETRAVPDFFPDGGDYRVVATVAGTAATAELFVRLYDAIPGPAGVDTVFVTVTQDGGVELSASSVD